MGKENIRKLAAQLLEKLREMPDGTVTSTARLANDLGYKDMGFEVLLDLHMDLFKLAEEHHILLDMSAHEGKMEGLPFVLTFVVRKE